MFLEYFNLNVSSNPNDPTKKQINAGFTLGRKPQIDAVDNEPGGEEGDNIAPVPQAVITRQDSTAHAAPADVVDNEPGGEEGDNIAPVPQAVITRQDSPAHAAPEDHVENGGAANSPEIDGVALQVPKSIERNLMPWWDQLIMYFGVLLGVLMSSFITQYKQGTPVSLSIGWTSIVISSVIALMSIPYVFDKLKLQGDSPFIVRFGFFVQNGIFWRVITDLIGKTYSG